MIRVFSEKGYKSLGKKKFVENFGFLRISFAREKYENFKKKREKNSGGKMQFCEKKNTVGKLLIII